MSMQPILRFESVEFRYGKNGVGLGPVSFSLHAGECVSLIGPNGAGKSTLLKLAAGLLRPHKGKVLLHGRDVRELRHKERARHIGYLPQNVREGVEQSVEEAVAGGRYPYSSGFGFLSREDGRIIEEGLRSVGMYEHRKRLLGELSGGEQRLALTASVLAQQSEVVLLDEPGAALDLRHRNELQTIFRAQAEAGKAVLTVTHDLNAASIHSDRIMLAAQGCIVRNGPVEEILTESVLRQYYGNGFHVVQHPKLGRPVVLPNGGRAGKRESAA